MAIKAFFGHTAYCPRSWPLARWRSLARMIASVPR
jgi:hypothetical protein